MISQRIASTPTGPLAFGETWYIYALYNDVTGNLTAGMPLYVSVLDAAQYNTLITSTATTTVAASATSGAVVLGTNAAAGSNLTCVGVYQPLNINEKPANGTIVRILCFGYGVVSAKAVTAGTAVTVGSKLLSNASVNAVAGSAGASLTIGTALATGTSSTVGSTIISVPGSGQTVKLINAFVNLC